MGVDLVIVVVGVVRVVVGVVRVVVDIALVASMQISQFSIMR